MTSSPERAIEPLPPALSSMWRLCKLGYRHEPRLMLAAFVLSQLAALPDALLALWLMLLGKGVIEHSPGLVRVSAIGLGVSAAATWFLRTISTRVQRRFRDKVTIALESHVARLQASVVTVAHHERPDYLDRLAMLRNQIFVLDHMYMSVFATVGWILRLAVTIALLMSIHPALALLGIFALPTVFTSTWRPAVERAAQEQGAPSQRLARHLFTTATTAPPGKEVRVTGIGERLIAQRRQAWERWYGLVSPVRWTSAAWHTLAWAVFGGAYVASVVFVSSRSGSSAGDVLLVLAAGSRLSAYIGATVGEIGFLRGFWMDGSRRLAWLEDYAASLVASADQPVPVRTKFFYGFGELALSLTTESLNRFLMFFYSDTLRLSPTAVGLMILLSKGWDAITDPAMGYLSDTTRSRRGRRRPYVILGAVPMGVCYALLFWPPQVGDWALLWYMLALSIALYTCFTIYTVPYYAWGAELSRDYHERTSIVQIRALLGLFGGVAGGKCPSIT